MLPGLDEGVRGMAPGGRRLLTVPPHLGYGEFSNPPNQTLVYELDLEKVWRDATPDDPEQGLLARLFSKLLGKKL